MRDVAVDHAVVEAQPVQDLAGPRLELVAAALLVLLLDIAEAGQDLVHLIGLVRVAHVAFEIGQPVVQLAHPPAAGDRLVEGRVAAHRFDVLPEVADRRALRNRDVALVGLLFTGDHAEDRRLPGAVGPDQTDLLPGSQLERGIDEQHLPSVLLGDVGERDHEDCTVAEPGRFS